MSHDPQGTKNDRASSSSASAHTHVAGSNEGSGLAGGEKVEKHESLASSGAVDAESGKEQEGRRAKLMRRLWPRRSRPAPLPTNTMDTAEVTPLATASFFSIITFAWIAPILTIGATRPLIKEDLWRLDDDRKVDILADRLWENFLKRKQKVEEWNVKVENGEIGKSGLRRFWWRVKGNPDGKKKIGLAGALSDTFFWSFWTAGFIKVISDTLQVTSPLVTKAIIEFGTDTYLAQRGVPGYTVPPIGRGVGAAIGLFLMQIVSSLCMHNFFYRTMEVGVLSRGALISTIYRRAMVLSGKSRAEIPNGKLVNHISTDVSRIDFCAGFFHMVWTAPIQLIIVIIILLVNLGASSLAGIGFLLIVTPFQTWAMKAMFSLRKKTMVWTDKRAKLLQELLGGMRIIKFFAWEIPYLDKLHEIRKNELGQIRKLLIIRAGNAAVALSLPVLATILAFTAYTLSGHNQNPAIIFTSLSLFNLLRMPLMMLPVSLGTITDAKNALDRLTNVFTAEEREENFIVEENLDVAVEVVDADFIWEGASPEGQEKKAGKGKSVAEKKDAAKSKTVVDKPQNDGKKMGKWSKKRWVFRKRDRKIAVEDPEVEGAKENKGGLPIATAEVGEAPLEKEALTEGATDVPAPVKKSSSASSESASDDAGLVPTLDKEPEEEPAPLQLRNISLSIPRGQLCAIVGPVGAGKSSLLQGLIGEMKKMRGTVKFGGSIGYCPQVAWIQNATLRDNVLFGQDFDQERYAAAIRDACLDADLEMLPNGDLTEIGEKGITLSGGQKARVNIARALYFNADITCLDDPLAAVDAHVGKHLFTHAIQGSLGGKTRILVTHALHFLPQCDYIICLENGQISEQGTYDELIARDGAFSRLVADFGGGEEETKEERDEKEEEAIEGVEEKEEKKDKPVKSKHTLMQEEERATGSVSSKVYGRYFAAGNGWYMVPLLIASLVLMQGSSVLNNYLLVWWQEDKFHMSQSFYLGIYGALGVVQAIFTFLMGICSLTIGYYVSKRLHRGAIRSVMHAPMSFFDTTPLGRIMNRFAKDIDTIDNTLNDSMRMALATLGQVIGAIVLIAIVQPYFLIAVAVIMFFYYYAARFYRQSAREIKRLDNLLRSSLYAHFSESLSGIATIRAYGETTKFVKQNEYFMDTENRAYYLTVVNQRWLGLRLDFLGSLLTFVVAIIAVAGRNSISPSQIGLILSYILGIQQSFSWMVRQMAEVENDMNSCERVLHYANELEQEAPSEIPEHRPEPKWPSKGQVEFKDVVMSYRPGLPPVLKGLSLNVSAGEKVGVVGRTGAGKSSIMMALFRIVELTEGRIDIDGIDISSIGLRDLRSKVAIIPQDALLFSGTIRSNLDPFGLYDDARLWDALKRAWLVDRPERQSMDVNGVLSTEKTQASRFTLDTVVEDEGLNLSVGERSLVSLARALVKDSQIIVLDEATASVDYETDSRIQDTVRTEFRGKTLLCIAHRLRTIISYDRIIVMDAGQIAEFDTPLKLFEKGGIFRGMCERSGITKTDIEKSFFRDMPRDI